MKIIFFGSGKFVLPIVNILRKNFEFVLVVTTEYQLADVVPVFCKKQNISYISIKQFNNETIKKLTKMNVPLAVLANFGLIIPKTILNAFPKGILNIHPSLLPKYRGPTPGQTAILNGETKTGVTIIKLDEEVDHGPIVTQVEEKILPTDTAKSLYERLFGLGAKLLPQTIKKYIKGEIKASPQDHSKATFTKTLTRQNGYINISNPPSPEVLERMIRAYHPWPGVWSKLKVESGKWKIVKFLPGQKIQVEGGKPMTLRDFLNGYPEAKAWLTKLFPNPV